MHSISPESAELLRLTQYRCLLCQVCVEKQWREQEAFVAQRKIGNSCADSVRGLKEAYTPTLIAGFPLSLNIV